MQTSTHTLPGRLPAAGNAGRNRLTNAPKLHNSPASGVRRPASGVRRPASGVRRPASGVRRPASGVRRPASGVRRPSGMTCARRPAGARTPASPTSAGPVPSLSRGFRRPEAGAERARLTLLPVLTLLLGAYSLFAAAPALAQGNAPAAPTNLTVTDGDRQLSLSWTASTGSPTGYDVHYTSAPASGEGAVANSATASGSDASMAWVAVTRSGATATQVITGLSNESVTYRVRVRGKNANGASAWLFGEGSPAHPVGGIPNDSADVSAVEGATVSFPFSFLGSSDLDAASTVTLSVGAATTAGSSDYTGLPRTVTLPADTNPITINVTSNVVNDSVNEFNELLQLELTGPTTDYILTGDRFLLLIEDNDPPAAPAGLSVSGGRRQVTARWNKPAGPVSLYEVRIKEASAPDQAGTTSVQYPGGDPSTGWNSPAAVITSGTSVTIAGLRDETTYHVQVRANDGQTATGNGYGAWSATQTATTFWALLSRPPNLRVVPGDGKLVVLWDNWQPITDDLGQAREVRYPSSHFYMDNSQTQVQWKKKSAPDSAWAPAPNVTNGESWGIKPGVRSSLNRRIDIPPLGSSSCANGGPCGPLENGAAYQVRIVFFNTVGRYTGWITLEGTPQAGKQTGPLGRAHDVRLTPENGKIKVTWNQVEGADRYALEWKSPDSCHEEYAPQRYYQGSARRLTFDAADVTCNNNRCEYTLTGLEPRAGQSSGESAGPSAPEPTHPRDTRGSAGHHRHARAPAQRLERLETGRAQRRLPRLLPRRQRQGRQLLLRATGPCDARLVSRNQQLHRPCEEQRQRQRHTLGPVHPACQARHGQTLRRRQRGRAHDAGGGDSERLAGTRRQTRFGVSPCLRASR